MRDVIARFNSLPPAEAAGRLGLTIRRGGRRLGPCPACGEDEPRGPVTIARSGRWHCWRCEKGGRNVDLVLATEQRAGFDRDMLARLEELLGGGYPETTKYGGIVTEPLSLPLWRLQQLWYFWHPDNAERQARIWCNHYLLHVRGLPEHPIWCRIVESIPSRSAAHCYGLIAEHPALGFALRTTRPVEEQGSRRNIMLRRTDPGSPKMLPLIRGGGSCSDNIYPLSYGRFRGESMSPLLLVEGALDWLTANAALPDNWIVVGARCAGDIQYLWPAALKEHQGPIVVVPHIDQVDARGRRAGPDACQALVRQLRIRGQAARLFPWLRFWALLGAEPHDLNDAVRAREDGGCGIEWGRFERAMEEALLRGLEAEAKGC